MSRVLVLIASLVFGPGALVDGAAQVAAKRIKEIRLVGLKYTDQDIVLREMVSRVGEPFCEKKARRDAERLDRLGIFSSIEVRHIEEPDGVILVVEVHETFPFLPMLSVEVTEENGASAGPGVKLVNLFGRAVFFSGAVRFGGATNVEVVARNSWSKGGDVSYQLKFFQRDRRNELDGFGEIATELELRGGKKWGESARIGASLGFVSIGGDVSGVTLSDDDRDNVPSLGLFLGYDSRDLWTNPSQGWWNEIEIVKRGGFLGGDGDFWTTNLDLRRYQPLGDDHTLALFSLATLQAGTVGIDIPVHHDFHIGGTNTVRGWSLGAREGKNQLLSTAEYRYTLLEPTAGTLFSFTGYLGVQLALFADAGLAWTGRDELSLDRFIDGYGFGVRFLVPFVDVVRVDFGFGEPGQGMTAHIAILPKAVMQRERVR